MKTTRFISCGMCPDQSFCLWTLSFISCSPTLRSHKASTITTVLVALCCCTADPTSHFLSSCKVLHPGRDDAAVFQSSEPKCFCGMFWEEEAGNRKSASRLRVRAQYQLCTFFFCGFTPGSFQPKQQEPAASCLISAVSTPLLCNLLCNLSAFP